MLGRNKRVLGTQRRIVKKKISFIPPDLSALGLVTDRVVREDVTTVTAALLESKGTPSVLTGVTKGWRAHEKWNAEELLGGEVRDSAIACGKFNVDGKKLSLEVHSSLKNKIERVMMQS